MKIFGLVHGVGKGNLLQEERSGRRKPNCGVYFSGLPRAVTCLKFLAPSACPGSGGKAMPGFRIFREMTSRIRSNNGKSARSMFNVMSSAGQSLTRVFLESNELQAFAKEIGAKAVTANVRAELADRKLEQKRQEEGGAVSEISCPKCGKRHSYPEDVMRVVEILQIACECGERLRKLSPLSFAQHAKV
jgi:hypothetical protein